MSLKRESNFLVARTGVTQSVITVHLKRFIQHIGQRRQQLLTSTRLSVYTGTSATQPIHQSPSRETIAVQEL